MNGVTKMASLASFKRSIKPGTKLLVTNQNPIKAKTYSKKRTVTKVFTKSFFCKTFNFDKNEEVDILIEWQKASQVQVVSDKKIHFLTYLEKTSSGQEIVAPWSNMRENEIWLTIEIVD